MKKYIVPNMEIITLETEDVITTSSAGCSGGAGTPLDTWCVIDTSNNESSICYANDDGCDSWADSWAD